MCVTIAVYKTYTFMAVKILSENDADTVSQVSQVSHYSLIVLTSLYPQQPTSVIILICLISVLVPDMNESLG